LVPGAVVYTVSVQFLARSIESWFDVKVDAALEGGINLGRVGLDQMLAELHTKARAVALELADRPAVQQVVLLGRLRDQVGAQEAVVVSAGGRVVASSSEDMSRLVPELPSQQIMRQARVGRGAAGGGVAEVWAGAARRPGRCRGGRRRGKAAVAARGGAGAQSRARRGAPLSA